MAWPIPPADGVDYRSWEFLKQPYLARFEKAVAAGFIQYPRSGNTWDSGTITAITSTTVTIGGKTWATDRWVGWVSVGLPKQPVDYDLIIDSCPLDPRIVIRAPISHNTGDTLTIANLDQNVTERRCLALTDLIGRSVAIVGRGQPWWSDRWIEFPNDVVYAAGRVKTAINGTIVAKSLRPPRGISLVGKEILFWNSLGSLQRGSVTSRVQSTLNFTGTTDVAVEGDYFVVVAANGYFRWPSPGRPPRSGAIRADYRGMLEPYHSHDARDVSRSMYKPQVTFQSYEGSDPLSCPGSPTTITVFDVDYITSVMEACVDADRFYAPDIHKTLRHLWVGMSQDLNHFVNPDITYTGATAIPVLNVATWMSCVGINSQTVTGGTVSAGALPYTITAPYLPIDIFFSVQNDKGDSIYFGETTYTGSGDTLGSTFTSANNGASIVVSLGPTRTVRRKFQRILPKTVLYPSVNAGVLVWPPTEASPGTYVTRGASTHYLAADKYNFLGESSLSVDAITDGDFARYVGDNFCNPSIEPHLLSSDTDPLLSHYERFFTGRRTKIIKASLDALRSGIATSGTTRQLTNNLVDLWGSDFYTPNPPFIRFGTATGGSTTTLIDTAQAGSAFFNDVTRNQVGLVITITLGGTDYKRLITSHTGTTLGFDEPLPTSVLVGTAYSIRETDGEKNRYKGLKIKVKQRPGNLSALLVIAGNDDTTFFFETDAPFMIDEKTAYNVSEIRTGGVWQRSSGQWIKAIGLDPRGTGTTPFRHNPNNNLPTKVTRYGWPRLGDAVTTQNWVQLFAAYDKIGMTKEIAAVSNRLNPSVSEVNSASNGGATGPVTCLSADNTGNPALYDIPACSVNPGTGIHDYTLMHNEVPMAQNRFEVDINSGGGSESIVNPNAFFYVQRMYPASSGTPNTYGDKPGSTEICNLGAAWSRLFTSRNKAGCGSWVVTIRWFCFSLIDQADHDEASSGDGYDRWEFQPGPEPLLHRRWAEVDSISSSPNAIYHSRKICSCIGDSMVAPETPSLPPKNDPAPVDVNTPGPDIIHYGGFYVSDTCALIDWRPSFTYI